MGKSKDVISQSRMNSLLQKRGRKRKNSKSQTNKDLYKTNTAQPISKLFSSKKVYVGTSRLYGAGPLRILPEISNGTVKSLRIPKEKDG